MKMRASSITLTLVLLAASLSCPLAEAVKIDCHPVGGATKAKCEALGCIWQPVERSATYEDQSLAGFEPPAPLSREGIQQQPEGDRSRVDEPWCHYPDDYVGYKVSEKSHFEFRLERLRPSVLADEDIKNVAVTFQSYNGGSVLRLRVFDADRERFEPELPALNLERAAQETSQFRVQLETRKAADGKERPYMLNIERVSTGAYLFSTDLSKLIFSDRFIQLNSKLASPFIFGLGEHYDNYLKLANKYKTFSFYNTDKIASPNGARSYGGFPFYVGLDSANNTHAHGLYLRNSNAMDIVLQNDLSLSFRPIGGVLDFFLFLGPTPLEATRQFQRLVGLPHLPPRWSLGFHLCRYNYNSLERTQLVWQRTRDSGIPFDVQWNDIDYMDAGNDFTYARDRFKGLAEFVDELHAKDMHYVLIFDPGLSQEADYYPYSLGERMGIFVRNATNQTLVGRVWNRSGRTVFPDFSNPRALDYWRELFVGFQRAIKFDGAWIDMNDISNFVDGSLDGCPTSGWPIERPPYSPGGYALQTKSLCLSAQHRAGREYDVHNLYSFYEAIATRHALEAARPQRRSLIISRSTHPGQGHFGGHWSGDVLSTWGYLRWSIPSLLEHSMYGFSMMGSDICGFVGNTSAQLCARWSTLGAFYTFSRNHNDDVSIDQDPVALGPVVVEANRNALTKRYSLLPYLYTLVHRAHAHGEPVARSTAFEFFGPGAKLADSLRAEDQFMWGRALLVSPVVEPDTQLKATYLPGGRWYELDITPESMSFEAARLKVPKLLDLGPAGAWHETANIELANLAIFYRGGHVIPVYPRPGQTVAATVRQPVGLEVALCQAGRAHGELILDDGESIHFRDDYLKFEALGGKLTVELVRDDFAKEVAFGWVKVYGLTSEVAHVQLDGRELPFAQREHVLLFDLAGAKVSKGRPLVASWT